MTSGILHDLFERTAERWPDRPALDIPPGTARPERRILTYAELGRRAEQLAAHLRDVVTGECVVAVLLPRSTEHLYVSQLAVLKAGAAFTCIDPSFPDDQVRHILEDAGAVALLTDDEGLARARRGGVSCARLIDVASAGSAWIDPPAAVPLPWLRPDTLAYVIYTSGTTGRPKGVMIEHAAIENLVASDLEEFRLGPGDRVGQASSAAYDSSLEEIWLAWAAGGTVVVADDETARLGPDLVAWLRRERVTVFCPPPTLLRAMGCDDPSTALPDVSLLYVGGEPLPQDIAERWGRGRRLENGYGPTECAVTSVRATVRPGEPIAIGRPVSGLRAWVLDDDLREVPDGDRGELCLGGAGLARGYLNHPDLTAQKFLTRPALGRIYRTGDLVHREADGRFYHHGRIDSQVKIRGYRIELEAVESWLAQCGGVRAAACTAQAEGSQQVLVAFVVPDDDEPPSFDALKESLRNVLPEYMVPARFAMLAALPTTVGGKLNRAALPRIEASAPVDDMSAARTPPQDALEERLAVAIADVLKLRAPIAREDDFFNDLGGDSLSAAVLVSRLRGDAETASVAVRDIYDARTVEKLAARVGSDGGQTGVRPGSDPGLTPAGEAGHPFAATCVQALCLAIELVLGSAAAYLLVFHAAWPLAAGLGLIPFILLAPLLFAAMVAVYTPVAVVFAVLVKNILIGVYRPCREPAWGDFYVRNWIVQRAVRLIPWPVLEGTVFQATVLRALGARIGSRVHIHGGVGLVDGGWDLLDIGDDVTIGRDASLRLVELDDGHIVLGAVSIGSGGTIDTRAGLGANTVMEPDAYLTALSALPSGVRIPGGERWAGIPAEPAGLSPLRPEAEPGPAMLPAVHGLALILAKLGVITVLALPFQLSAIGVAILAGFTDHGATDGLLRLASNPRLAGATVALLVLPLPIALVLAALLSRAIGRVREGVVSRWSAAYIRVEVKTWLLQESGDWLSGTLFWPAWLRLAGMRIGARCEISTILDVVPELVTVGEGTFFADGIYLGAPRVHRGTVTLMATSLGQGTFLGNHAIIAAGQRLPDGILLGIATVADDTAALDSGTSWFGHPRFELPRREVVACDRALTHDPSPIRYVNRVFWELLRFALPVVPLSVATGWVALLALARATLSPAIAVFVAAPAVTLGAAALPSLLVLALKWGLLGRVRPGVHPLWSCWCSRWDFLYVAWAVDARGAVSALEGTLLLACYLRAMGASIGRRVLLGRGFAQIVDPDMLHFEDDSTVSCQFQAHTFEDRVLKIDHIWIRSGATVGDDAVLLYGAEIGRNTHVAPHSVVMKRESLLPNRRYEGCPTRARRSPQAAALTLATD